MRSKADNIVNIITLGCSKNLVDSEDMATQLNANHFEVKFEDTPKKNAISIINTCGFIESAKEESIKHILEQVELKKKNKIKKVFVTGCLSERYKTELAKEIPDVDGFFGTLELKLLLQTLNANYKKELVGERMLSTPTHYAYLKISEGCNRTCSFCAIPLMRGTHKSKTIDALVAETKRLAQKGVKEILLIAQELTYYGLDIYKKRALPQLLEALADIKGIEWIRLHYAYPSKFPLEIIDVIKQHPNICNYLDMPLQHASDKVLQDMKRQITVREMNILLDKIRTQIPNIILRTTFIVGYPNETEKDFEILCNFVKHQQFDRVGIFKYSHEESTAAFQVQDNITPKIKQTRYDTLMKIQQQISIEKNHQKIGQTFKVLIDSKEAGKYIGRTFADSPEVDNAVIIDTQTQLTIGSFYQVYITDAYDYDMVGRLV